MGIGVLLAEYAPKLAEDLLEPVTKIAKFMLLLVVSIEKMGLKPRRSTTAFY